MVDYDLITLIIVCGLISLISGLLYVLTYKVDHDEMYNSRQYEEYSRDQYDVEVLGIMCLYLGIFLMSSIACVIAIANLFS